MKIPSNIDNGFPALTTSKDAIIINWGIFPLQSTQLYMIKFYIRVELLVIVIKPANSIICLNKTITAQPYLPQTFL